MSPSSSSSFRFILLLIVVFLCANAFFSAYIFLENNRAEIERELSQYFKQTVFVGKLVYLPPNFVILKNISSFSRKKGFSFFIEKVKLKISLKGLISKRAVAINDICLEKPKFYFIGELKTQDVQEALNALSSGYGVKLLAEDAELVFLNRRSPVKAVSISSLSASPEGSVVTEGKVIFSPGQNSENKNLIFSSKLKIDRSAVMIENLELKQDSLYAKFWGTFERSALGLNGFCFLNTQSDRSPGAKTARVKAVARIKKIWQATQVTPVSAKAKLNILDIACVMKFSEGSVDVKQLRLSLNKIPLLVKGAYYFGDSPKLNMSLSSYPNHSPAVRFEKRAFDIDIEGRLSHSEFIGKIMVGFLRKIGNSIINEKVSLEFDEPAVYSIAGPYARLSFADCLFSYASKKQPFKLAFSDFKGLIKTSANRIGFEFSSGFYGGSLKGDGLLDTFQVPPQNYLNIEASNVDAAQIDRSVLYFANAQGRLNAKVSINSYPDLSLNAGLKISDGALRDVEFFNWLSNFFGITSLKEGSFNNLSLNIFINDKVTSLNNIELDAKEMDLRGEFSLTKNELVSGKMFLTLPSALLGSSEDFKPLLRILGNDIEYVNFDFQVSGLLEAMNFKWLDSEFKKKLEDRLPGFVERGIERQVEAVISSILSAKEGE